MEIFLDIAKQYGPFITVCSVFLWYVINQNKKLDKDRDDERDKSDAFTKELIDMIKNDTIATVGQTTATVAHTAAIQSNVNKIDALISSLQALANKLDIVLARIEK